MRTALVTGALVLSSLAAAGAQPVLVSERVTLGLTSTSLAEAFAAVAKAGGVTIEFDDSVTDAVLARRVGRIKLVDATVESALKFLTGQAGLTFVVIDPRTVRIQPKPGR